MEGVELERAVYDFNYYREVYPMLSFKDLVAITKIFDQKYPNQKYYNLNIIKRCFDLIKEPMRVFELGCHDGSLAKEIILWNEHIKYWDGYDINEEAINRGYHSNKYSGIPLKEPFYGNWKYIEYEVFICTHTLEHFSGWEVKRILENIAGTKYVVLEIPLTRISQTWENYDGLHVLYEGKIFINGTMTKLGYEKILEEADVMMWKKSS